MGIGTASGFSWTKYRFSNLTAHDQTTVSRQLGRPLSHPPGAGAAFRRRHNSEHRPIFDTHQVIGYLSCTITAAAVAAARCGRVPKAGQAARQHLQQELRRTVHWTGLSTESRAIAARLLRHVELH